MSAAERVRGVLLSVMFRSKGIADGSNRNAPKDIATKDVTTKDVALKANSRTGGPPQG